MEESSECLPLELYKHIAVDGRTDPGNVELLTATKGQESEDGSSQLSRGRGRGRQTHRRPVSYASRSPLVPSVHLERTTLTLVADLDLVYYLKHVGSLEEVLSRDAQLQALCLPSPQMQRESC